MTALELLLVLILAGVIIVLLYFYLQDNRGQTFTRARSIIVETGEKARSTVSGANDKIKDESKSKGGIGETMSGMGEKTRSAFSGATDKIKVDKSTMGGVTEKVSGVGEKLKDTVKGNPESDEELSNKIDLFLEEKKDQIIKDWELTTKDDYLDLEKRYTKLSMDMGKLDNSLNNYREFSNKKFKEFESRLSKLEKP